MKYIFTYDENISQKGVEPLLELKSLNCIRPENNISNYFYNLKTEEIEELERIYDYSKKINNGAKDTINKDSWLCYKIANNINIPALSETIKQSEIKINNDNSINVEYGNNGKFKTLSFQNKKTYSLSKMKSMPLFEYEINNLDIEKNILFLHKEGVYESNIEFLYMVLNCLFSSNNLYYIKKMRTL